MADKSNIAWTLSTFNPWIGCTKVGPGCDHCYAENQDSRKRWGGTTHWGAGVPRMRTSVANWRKPLTWNKQAPTSEFAGRRGFWPVFCASLADVFDNDVPEQWRQDLWMLIITTPNLSWLLVTKRIGNVERMVPAAWRNHKYPDNLRIMITVVNQEEADRDVPKLLAIPCNNGISYEPALGPVDWRPFLAPQFVDADGPKRRIEWLIVGGESSQGSMRARAFDMGWARSTVVQCRAAGVPAFVKQMGSSPFEEFEAGCDHFRNFVDRAGSDPGEWPADLNVREFPI